MTIVERIAAEAQAQGVDPRLAIEMATEESGLNPNVRDGAAGEIGIFQVEPATAADFGVSPAQLRDVATNIRVGVGYLRQQIAKFGDAAAALAAYNWGPGRMAGAMAQWGAAWFAHIPSSTQRYVNNILGRVGSYAASLTPASVANGVVSLVAAQPAGAWVPWALAAAFGLGVLWLGRQFSD